MGKYCAQCGQELKPESKFCPKCGKRIEQEKSLVERAQDNDVQAWEMIYQNTYARAYSIAVQIVKSREDALDILQEAYISAFKNINSLRDDEKIGAWINSIVSNRCKDWIRKKKPMLFTDMNSEEYDVEFEDMLMNDNQEFMPEESVDYEQTKAIMQEILWKLPEDQRLCVLMYYYNEMSISAIAETLECSSGTIKSRLNYARKFIKKEVEALEKKGTKLYSVAPMPFIVWMLHNNERAIMEETSESLWKNAVKELIISDAKEVKNSAIEKKIKQKAEEKIVKKSVSKAGRKYIAKKIISGIVAVSLVGTGSYVASKKYHNKPDTIKVAGTKDTGRKDTESDKNGTEVDLRNLKKQIDYEYLERLCSYFPSNTNYEDMTDEDWKKFYTTIMQTAYEDYYCPHEYGEHLDKSFRAKDVDLISKEEFVTHDKKNGVSFKKDALDKVQQISGSKVNPQTMTDPNGSLSYNKDKYELSSELLNTLEKCTVTGKNIDYDEKSVLVNIEKSIIEPSTDEYSDTDYKMRYKYYTVVLKVANNNYGYKIADILIDYDIVENDPVTIAENVKENPENVLNLAKILDSYDVEDATSSTEKEKDIMKKILYNAGNASLVEPDQGHDDFEEYYKPKDGVRACELAGISDKVINNFIDDDELEFNSLVYKINPENDEEYYDANYYYQESFFLRAESNTKKNIVTCYCLLHDNSKENGKFERETIVLEPYLNSLGYRIKKITRQEWKAENNTCKDEIQKVIKREKEMEKGFDTAIASEGAETASECSELWKGQATMLTQKICDKYPKQKKQIEEAEKKYWDTLDKKIEQVNENPFLEGNGALGATNGNTDKMKIYYQGAKSRVYFLIGNALMDKKVDVLYE